MWNRASIWEMAKFVIVTALIVVPFRMYIAQPFVVSGASMEKTYYNGDYLIINEISYRFSDPKKNDVIIFKYPKDQSKFFIKRIINLPGETVNYGGMNLMLGPDEYFVMGDNRPFSSDSRVWGPVSRNLIIGKTLVRLWSTAGIARAIASMREIF